MSERKPLSDAATAELNDRLISEIVPKIVDGPLAVGVSVIDVLMLCEGILLNVILECFKHGVDAKVPGTADAILDAITTRVKQRLVEIPLEEIETKYAVA